MDMSKHKRFKFLSLLTFFFLLSAIGLAGCSDSSKTKEENVNNEESAQKEDSAKAEGSSEESDDEVRTAEQILEETCMACHAGERLGRAAAISGSDISRIKAQRKTPEGWLMTIARMQVTHGVQISDEDRRTLVKYLADSQGLAPSESEDSRYALERRLNTQEDYHDEEIGEMCARCHSGARFALQRRTAEEWEHMVHFHLGQWPSLEYQAMSRDRDWLKIALEDTVQELTEDYPFHSDEWDEWQENRPSAEELKGSWGFSGHYTGKGSVSGVMKVSHEKDDEFTVELDGTYADGKPFKGKGDAILYNGHEWRANIDVDGDVMRQVFTVLDNEMTGRMFQKEHYERGLDVTALHETQRDIIALQPSFVKAGEEATVRLVGNDIGDDVDFGKSIKVVDSKDVSSSAKEFTLRVDKKADLGKRKLKVNGDESQVELAIYEELNKITIAPDYAVARIGGGGGSTEKVQGRFDAIGWAKVDGEDIELGPVPAEWKVEPFDDDAEKNKDVDYAGEMDKATGIFSPAVAGPNPERERNSNNIGNLAVIAKVKEGDKKLTGEGQLIVGVPVWSIPPIP